jgi:hypothetical protein
MRSATVMFGFFIRKPASVRITPSKHFKDALLSAAMMDILPDCRPLREVR